MFIKKFLAPVMGLTVADVVSAAKIRFSPGRVNRLCHPQLNEVYEYNKEIFRPLWGADRSRCRIYCKKPIRLMVWRIFLFHFNCKRNPN